MTRLGRWSPVPHRMLPSTPTNEVEPVNVGVPKEVKPDEYRVAITPAGVRELTSAGHTVYVEEGAGVGSSIPDSDFVATGARILESPDDIWADSEMILGVKEPIAEEYPRLALRKGQVLFTYLHLAASLPCTDALMAAGNTAIAYETVRLPDNSLPLLTPMSEVAGRMAPLMGAHHLMRPGGGRGVLVDISVDQGGCFESTRPTTHSDPTFEVNGSLFYCVANMPGAVPHSSTHALVNATLPYVLDIANHGWRDAALSDAALAEGVNVVEGAVVYEPVAAAHGMATTPLDSLIG